VPSNEHVIRRVLALAALALLVVGCGAYALPDGAGDGLPTATPGGPRVVFPTVSVAVELAHTDAEREKGLGGHAPLGERDGMLFIFDQPGQYAFWMKGMTFALDIIWIDNGRVVYLAPDLPPPAPGATDETLPITTPSAEANYVLEVNAGFAKQHGIELGTAAQIVGA
jgi:uncharacterized protein